MSLGLAKREKIISPLWGVLLLLAAFFMLYQPWFLGVRELYRLEGFYATQALEMDPALPLATAHGVAIRNAFPLYPLTASLLHEYAGIPVIFALRLLSVMLTVLTAGVVYLAARGARSATAAQAATAMFLGLSMVTEKSLDAYPATTVMFGILSAQLVWFYFGVQRVNWNAAWILSWAIMTPTFYAGGFRALLFFIVPLIFMRRPLTVWSKLARPGFAGGLVLLAGGIALWGVPYWFFSRMMPLQYWSLGTEGIGDYLREFAEYPFSVAMRFLPWLVICWGPFCVALQPQDETPIFGRYLRTIFISTFFLIWLLPETESRDLLFLAPSLAILTGMYYDAVVRRYGRFVNFSMRLCGIFSVLAGLGIAFFALLPEEWLKRGFEFSKTLTFKHDPRYLAAALTAAALCCWFGILISAGIRKRRPAYFGLLLTAVAVSLFHWSVLFPYRAEATAKRNLGQTLRAALTADGVRIDGNLVIYKSDILDLYAECCYLGAKVRKIESPEDLPKATNVVYLLSTEFPQANERNWSNLLPPDLVYMKHRLCLWRGELRRDPVKSTPVSAARTEKSP